MHKLNQFTGNGEPDVLILGLNLLSAELLFNGCIVWHDSKTDEALIRAKHPFSMVPSRSRHGAVVFRIFLAVVVTGVIIVLALMVMTDVADYFNLQIIEDTIISWGPYGVVLSIALMVLHTFVPFPAEILAIANGMVYGPFWGIVITWVGAMLGAGLAFALSRTLGRPFVEQWVSHRDAKILDRLLQTDATYVVLIARFIPVIAFNLVNFVAGLLHISWCRFLVATAVGILPVTILAVLVGDSLNELSWEISIAIVVLLLLTIPLIRVIRNRLFKSQAESKH